MTGAAREGVTELERSKVGFRSRPERMISLVAGFRQTLKLAATFRPNALNPDKASPFSWSQMDWEQPHPAGGLRMKPIEKFVSVMTVAIHHSLKEVRCEVHNGEFPC